MCVYILCVCLQFPSLKSEPVNVAATSTRKLSLRTRSWRQRRSWARRRLRYNKPQQHLPKVKRALHSPPRAPSYFITAEELNRTQSIRFFTHENLLQHMGQWPLENIMRHCTLPSGFWHLPQVYKYMYNYNYFHQLSHFHTHNSLVCLGENNTTRNSSKTEVIWYTTVKIFVAAVCTNILPILCQYFWPSVYFTIMYDVQALLEPWNIFTELILFLYSL